MDPIEIINTALWSAVDNGVLTVQQAANASLYLDVLEATNEG